jgi:hypothetical protein
MRSRILVLAAAALCAAPAFGGVDAQTGLAVKAKSTLAPSSPTDTYRFTVAAGAKLTFALAAARKGQLQFAPTLTDPLGGDVALGGVLVATKTGVAVKSLPLAMSGEYRLDVAATGSGDYSLAMTATPQAKFTGTLTLAAAQSTPFAFAALPGSSLTLSAKAAKASAATPTFGLLTGVGYQVDLSQTGKRTTTSHVVSATNVGGAGDLSVNVTNPGGAGDATVSVVVKPSKTKTTKLDARGVRLGRPGGGQTFVGRAIDASGGTVTVSDAASDLFGASVSIPSDDLGGPVVVTVASASVPPLPSRDLQAAGPAVDLGPSGITFVKAASVTLPFDFSRLPANASPSDIRVLVREKNGTTLPLITPTSIDPVAGTITLPTSGFSVCVPVVRSGIPRLGLTPGGDEYWTLFLLFSAGQDPTANDSRSRNYELNVGEASFFSDGTVQVSQEQRSVQVDNPDDGAGGVGGTVQSVVTGQNGAGTWTYDADGTSIDVVSGGSDQPVFHVSRDGSAMIGHGESASAAKVEIDVLLRKNKTSLAVADLSGTWRFAALDVNTQSDGPGQPARTQPDHATGTFAFDGNGGCRIVGADHKSRYDSATGAWQETIDTLAVAATYSVEAAGTVLVNVPPQKAGDTGDVFRLYPGTDAATFLGTDSVLQGSDLFAIFLVKEGSGLSVKSLDGPYRSSDIQTDVSSYTVNPGGAAINVSDLEFRDEDLSVVFDGTASATLAQTEHAVQRDTATSGGVLVDNSSGPLPVSIALSSTGALTFTPQVGQGGVVGAVSPDGMFGFFASGPQDTSKGNHLLGFFVRSAPLP